MSKIFLETTNLKKIFNHINGSITLFKDLNIKIKEGDLVALVGPSGSGKSSLLHLLALLDEPTQGKIILNNQQIEKLNSIQKDNLRRKNISIIFQDNNLLSDFTAVENIMMPLIISGEEKKTISNKAKKIMKDVKIFNRANHFPNELSGGEQQRVAIARALIAETKLILADEPTGNLDPETSEGIMRLLIAISKEKNAAILMATHDMHIVKLFPTKTLLVDKGLIVEQN